MMVNNMLRKMKRSMSLLLAAAMLVSMAAGCGSSSAGNSGSTQTTAAATTAEAETAAPPVTEEMYFPNGDKQIYAVMYKPAEEKESYPTVIISHGFAGNYEDNTGRAEFFAKNGYAAVVFDFYGGGRASKSGGAMTDMSVLTEATDLEAVMDGVRSLDYVDSSNLFLLGCSQGGFVSSYVAAQRSDDVAALVLLFPEIVKVLSDFQADEGFPVIVEPGVQSVQAVNESLGIGTEIRFAIAEFIKVDTGFQRAGVDSFFSNICKRLPDRAHKLLLA